MIRFSSDYRRGGKCNIKMLNVKSGKNHLCKLKNWVRALPIQKYHKVSSFFFFNPKKENYKHLNSTDDSSFVPGVLPISVCTVCSSLVGIQVALSESLI